MEISTLKKLVKWSVILSIAGVIIELINIAGSLILTFSTAGGVDAANAFSIPLRLLLGVISLGALVLGVLLFNNLPKAGKSMSSGVLLIISGVFAWFNLFVPLIAWIFAAGQLLRMKLDDRADDNQIIL